MTDIALVNPVPKAQSLIGKSRFQFLNEAGDLGSAEDWNSPKKDRLWLYNAHYFDDLVAAGAHARRNWHLSLIERWIDENPVGIGCGWEPYPVSLRIVNWIKFHLSGTPLDSSALDSLAIQVRFLRRRIEYHLMGNHLIANAKALFIGGCFFDGDEADAWRHIGCRILRRQIHEQVLPDGGHVERSPMYHCLVLEDLLDIVNVAAAYSQVAPEGIRRAVVRMLLWSRQMTHPDGEISMFNDSAMGITPRPDAVEEYADRLGIPVMNAPSKMVSVMPDSGYVRVETERLVLIIDAAPIGPDYLPGHAHADTLSFECSVGTQRVFVNSGTSTYEAGRQRHWQRSTAAHNTVTIDHENSSEVWGAFRVAQRARPINLQFDPAHGVVAAGHDGYRRLPGKVTHHRTWSLTNGGFKIEDRLIGEYTDAVGRLYLHPKLHATVDEGARSGTIEGVGGSTIRWRASGGSVTKKNTYFFPEFGKAMKNLCLEFRFKADQLVVDFLID